jgi:hypothetical protein
MGARALAAALAAVHLLSAHPAAAVLNSPGFNVPRSVDAALRRSTPAFNPDVEALQKRMENIAFLLRIPQVRPPKPRLLRVGAL